MMESVMNSVNAKRKSEGEGSGVVVTPSVSAVHQPSSVVPSTSHCPQEHAPKIKEKIELDKGLEELESTLEGYFTYIGAKITDVATAGTAPKSQADPTGKNTCQVCGKVNASWLDMRKHMRTHADFKPYKCNLCPRSFHDMYKLKRHLIIHSGLKPYQCHICDQKLSRAEHLRRHLLIHKEIKPFKCNLCEFAARRTDSVKSHQKSKHPGEWVHVVTVKSIVDIVTDATTITTNLVPNPKRKKKKKKLTNTAPTIYPAASSSSASTSHFNSIVPSIEELSRISGLSIPSLKAERTSSSSTPSTSASSSSAMPSTSSTLRPLPQSSPSPYMFHTSSRHHGPGLSPGSSTSSRVSESSPSPAKPTNSPSPGMSSPPPKFLHRSHHHHHHPSGSGGGADMSSPGGGGGGGPPMSSPLSVPSRPPLHPVIGMNTVSQTAAAGLNYYPSLPGQFMGPPVPSSQPISPYFAMKPVFPEAMPVNQHHVNRMSAHGPASHHKQEPLNCSQGKPNLYSNNNHRMGSPNS